MVTFMLWAFPIFYLGDLPLSQWNCFLADCGSFCNLPVQFRGQQQRGMILNSISRSSPRDKCKAIYVQNVLSNVCEVQICSVLSIFNSPSENSQLLHCSWCDCIKGNSLIILAGLYCSTQQWPDRCTLTRIFYSFSSNCWDTLTRLWVNCLNTKVQILLFKKISKA